MLVELIRRGKPELVMLVRSRLGCRLATGVVLLLSLPFSIPSVIFLSAHLPANWFLFAMQLLWFLIVAGLIPLRSVLVRRESRLEGPSDNSRLLAARMELWIASLLLTSAVCLYFLTWVFSGQGY